MKEITRIITIEMMCVDRFEDDNELTPHNIASNMVKDALINNLEGVDSVVVSKIQDFIRDIPTYEDGEQISIPECGDINAL